MPDATGSTSRSTNSGTVRTISSRSAKVIAFLSSNANILVPQLRVLGNKPLHHLNAPRVLHDLDTNASGSQQIFLTHEGPVLSDDDVRNAVQQNCAGTHRTGR